VGITADKKAFCYDRRDQQKDTTVFALTMFVEDWSSVEGYLGSDCISRLTTVFPVEYLRVLFFGRFELEKPADVNQLL